MSDLSAEVLANLSAIRDNKPWPNPEIAVPLFAVVAPNDLVPASTWRLTPDGAAVLAMAGRVSALEADVAKREAVIMAGSQPGDLVPMSDANLEALLLLGRGVHRDAFYMAPDWAIEPKPDAVGERPPMRLTQAGKAWLAERVARMSNMADARVNALDNRVREIFTEPITVEDGIERLARERADLRKRMADTDAFVAAWAKGAEAACARQPLSACPHTDQYLIDAWTGGYAHEGWIPGGVLAVEREAEIRAEVLRPAPDDLLGQRLVNGRASLPDDTPTWVGALLDEALGAIQALRADGRTKAAQVESADAKIERLPVERDAERARADGASDLLAAVEKMEEALVKWGGNGPRGHSMEGSIRLRYDATIGQFEVEGEEFLRAKRDRLLSAILWWANPRKKPERAPEHKALSDRCIRAEDRVTALERERDEAKALAERRRLELAAELCQPEGAPSARWFYDDDDNPDERGRWRTLDGGHEVWWSADGWVYGRKTSPWSYQGPADQPSFQPARAAMELADKHATATSQGHGDYRPEVLPR